jgi:uncharacterized protein YjbI with pentapeptide repeats
VLVLSGVALLAGMAVLLGWVDWPTLGRWARPLAVPLALFAVAGGGVAAAVARLLGDRATRARAAGMSWWFVVAATIVIGVGWVATSWLLNEAGQATTADAKASARVEALKTGLGIGAGTTGIFALLLAVRRQQHSERDATEKNVTELYTKAADQLGSEQAPVRLAGLYALERLAQSNPRQRQSIVNVICAYLRMPFTPPDTEPSAAADAAQLQDHQRRVQEREVRLAAQRILTEHLRPKVRRLFWENIDLDLTNAHLIDFTLVECRVRAAAFVGATFDGDALFHGATFDGDALFANVTFTGRAEFGDAHFSRHVTFVRATFGGGAAFGFATFDGRTAFDGAKFTGRVRFDDATFPYVGEPGRLLMFPVTFIRVTFTGGAEFGRATFDGGVAFHGATFNGHARFKDMTFTDIARFENVTFTGGAEFEGATFAGDVRFDSSTFDGKTGFGGTTFSDVARFENVTFTGSVEFGDAHFIHHVTFEGATFTGLAHIGHRGTPSASAWA